MADALLVDRGENITYRDPDDPDPRPLGFLRLEPLRKVPIVNKRIRDSVADADELPRLPMQLIEKYADLAVRHAIFKEVEDGELFGTIPGFPGVWAKEATEDQVRGVLREVVEDWAVLKIQHEHGDLPKVDEIDLNVL